MGPLRPSLIAAALLWTLPVFADDELTVEKIAQVQAEQEKARAEVSKQFGDRKSSEMTNAERGEQIKLEQAAIQEVLDKHGVDAKSLAIRELRMGNDERAAVKAAKEDLAEREKAQQEAQKAEAPPSEEQPPEIIRGTSDENPVEVYRDTESVAVERPNEDGVIEEVSEETSIIPQGEITR